MLCYEVLLNGARVCLAGDTRARLLSTSLISSRGADIASLRVDADLVVTPTHLESVRWTEASLRIGDELLIRITDSATADVPKPVQSFGRRITAVGETEDSCSFCGEKGEVRLIKGIAGNICDKCVALCQEILEEEQGNESVNSEDKGT
jgi:hypothetical protein